MTDGLLENAEQLEAELKPEPLMAPAMGSLALHLGLGVAIAVWGLIGGFFHHSTWGTGGSGGAIQVQLVSSALPLPNDQPQNQNVLSTEKPSQAPQETASKSKQAVDETAIAIKGKDKKKEEKTAVKSSAKPMQPAVDNRAKFGEQAGSNIARSVQQQVGTGPVSVTTGDFGTRFGWYVDGINRKVRTNWYSQEVDPRTPRGTRVYLVFNIRKDGSPATSQVDKSSGSSTLDRSCLRAVQRVDTFGNLPAGYNGNTISVSYYCEY